MAKGETYEEFVEKFKPKKTTDDCMTPRDKIFGGGVIVADKVVRRLLNNLAAKEEEKTREAAGGTVKADRFKFSDNEKAILKKLNGES